MADGLWRTAGVSAERAERVAAEYGVPLRVARWLCARGLDEDSGELAGWLDATRVAYTDPHAFHDMAAAVTRMLHAISRRERIGIIGDYDVDGVTASAILADVLTALGADWRCFIPHREQDGYGLSEALVNRAREAGCQLLVTVDNGIRAGDAIAYAREAGLDVVVTDHHEPGPEPLPPGLPVVHWTRADDEAVRVLSGAGVAWKFASALEAAATGDGGIGGTRAEFVSPHSERTIGDAAERRRFRLGMAALGALADVMPMFGENRRLVVDGVAALKGCRRPGWLALCEAAGVDLSQLTPTAILWRLVPRLNAAGRMESAHLALRLLLAEESRAAAELAQQLEELNDLRKRETERAAAEAREQADAQVAAGAHALVVHGPWPLGVAGIVATRLVDHYGKPVLVLADAGEPILRGSGRAPEGVSLHTAMIDCADAFDHFGGHDGAVGCAVRREHIEEVKRRLFAAVAAHAQAADEGATEPLADDYLPLAEATLELADWVERLGPYGPGYPVWRFYIGPVRIEQVRRLGNGRHARIRVKEAGTQRELIWFGAPSSVEQWRPGDALTAIVELERNVWQGQADVQLRVVQATVSPKVLTREHFAEVYRLLRARRRLCASEVQAEVPHYSPQQVTLILETFVELGFAHRQDHAYHVVEYVEARDLREAAEYRRHLRQTAILSG
jgi:single-stranded-DNA-specific exonuclease